MRVANCWRGGTGRADRATRSAWLLRLLPGALGGALGSGANAVASFSATSSWQRGQHSGKRGPTHAPHPNRPTSSRCPVKSGRCVRATTRGAANPGGAAGRRATLGAWTARGGVARRAASRATSTSPIDIPSGKRQRHRIHVVRASSLAHWNRARRDFIGRRVSSPPRGPSCRRWPRSPVRPYAP